MSVKTNAPSKAALLRIESTDCRQRNSLQYQIFQGRRRFKCRRTQSRPCSAELPFAVSTDENRYVLNGLYLSFKENKLTMVATDGRRLALAEEDVELKDDDLLEVIVPTKAIQELSRSLGDKGDVEIQITENQVSFGLKENDGTGSLIVSKLVEGAYPNYKQVIPAESKHRVTLDKEELFHALRQGGDYDQRKGKLS